MYECKLILGHILISSLFCCIIIARNYPLYFNMATEINSNYLLKDVLVGVQYEGDVEFMRKIYD